MTFIFLWNLQFEQCLSGTVCVLYGMSWSSLKTRSALTGDWNCLSTHSWQLILAVYWNSYTCLLHGVAGLPCGSGFQDWAFQKKKKKGLAFLWPSLGSHIVSLLPYCIHWVAHEGPPEFKARCYGLNVCVSPKFICGIPNPQCDGVWR